MKLFADRTNWNLAPNRLAEALARQRAAGKLILDLTASNPTRCGFDYDARAILQALSNPAALTYEPNPKGLQTARQAVCAYYAARGAQVASEDIFITASTSEAYSFAFRVLCNPGDEVLIPAPSYPLFDFLAGIQDVKLVRYPLVYDHGWQIDFHALERGVTSRTRGAVVIHPNNPTGHFCKDEDFAKLNQIASTHSLALIADEVFLDFALAGNQAPTFAGNHRTPTLTLSGLSKISGLPQMKIAWLVVSGPEPWKSQAMARLEVIADTYLSAATPPQIATPVLLEQRNRFQPQLMARMRANLAEVDRQVTQQKSCNRLVVEGGWYAVLRVPATRSDENLALELLTTKNVYVHPGHFYDFSCDGYIVLSLIPPPREFAEGVRRLLEMF